LRQVLINLIGNAVKFTERGTITMRLHVDRSCRPLRLEVEDTGAGIPPDRIDAVFEPFEHADASISRQHGATGLGLSISRAFCDAMGLSLTLQSQLGRGSTFVIAFP
jgi:signal transduction histidine kinase